MLAVSRQSRGMCSRRRRREGERDRHALRGQDQGTTNRCHQRPNRIRGIAEFGSAHTGDHVFVGNLNSQVHAFDGRAGENPTVRFWVR